MVSMALCPLIGGNLNVASLMRYCYSICTKWPFPQLFSLPALYRRIFMTFSFPHCVARIIHSSEENVLTSQYSGFRPQKGSSKETTLKYSCINTAHYLVPLSDRLHEILQKLIIYYLYCFLRGDNKLQRVTLSWNLSGLAVILKVI